MATWLQLVAASLSPGVNGCGVGPGVGQAEGPRAPTPATPRTRARHQEDAGSATSLDFARDQKQAIHPSQARAMGWDLLAVLEVGTPSLTHSLPRPLHSSVHRAIVALGILR
ncbi:hypothetical protein BGZ61DRAFT_23399 [Ilyonectria robusta]|uniref:uncharacterized protein n=1 Tax=Ilyonectria robusta TaxID=1079257 RepID=UPI001E8E33FB|nr:uncharacterized protein BGZ61DRAFT_23399 [Ilyonectria robusta]KAH8737824.1 hypothetical protein BGZ61DRAFT_23399 [Ilyonectria robusta]